MASVLEIIALFVVLFIFGGYRVPDVNEVYYVGKAVHFWNPGWIEGDTFLDSKDAHWFFYATFGTLSLIFNPLHMAWAGRILAWFFFAFAWRRLSFTLIPIRYVSLITLAGLLYYVEAFQMSGEWIVGGIEGKCLAYPFLLLGLDAYFKGQWKRLWIFLGLSSAFHVLVGGWAVVIIFVLWAFEVVVGRLNNVEVSSRPPILTMLPFLVLGGLLSLPGLLPALLLNYGTESSIVNEAHRIYVIERLSHHLLPSGFPALFQLRFAALVLLWGALCVVLGRHFRAQGTIESCDAQQRTRFRRLGAFVLGSLVLAGIGFAIFYRFRSEPALMAGLMRFYWFRMSDVAVPMGVSFLSCFLLLKIATNWLNAVSNDTLKAKCTTFLALFLTAFGIFIAIHWFLFQYHADIWSPIPDSPMKVRRSASSEPGIPWAATLLISMLALAILARFGKKENVTLCGWTLLFAAITLWQPAIKAMEHARARASFSFSRSDSTHFQQAHCWQDACRWIRDPANEIPLHSRFLTPQDSSTFKWYAARSEVATWKDIPQDAEGIVKWYKAIDDLYQRDTGQGVVRRDIPLSLILNYTPPRQYEHLRKKYGFDYIICTKEMRLSNRNPAEKRIDLPLLYENLYFCIYKAEPKNLP